MCTVSFAISALTHTIVFSHDVNFIWKLVFSQIYALLSTNSSFTHFLRPRFTHFFRQLFWTEKQNLPTFLPFECVLPACDPYMFGKCTTASAANQVFSLWANGQTGTRDCAEKNIVRRMIILGKTCFCSDSRADQGARDWQYMNLSATSKNAQRIQICISVIWSTKHTQTQIQCSKHFLHQKNSWSCNSISKYEIFTARSHFFFLQILHKSLLNQNMSSRVERRIWIETTLLELRCIQIIPMCIKYICFASALV